MISYHRSIVTGPISYRFPLTAPRRTTLGDRSFPAAAAQAWNTLPQQVQDAPSLPVFRRELKTVLFQSSFPAD